MILTADNRQEWLEFRRGILGGTDVAGIVGKHKWKTPLTVYADKVLGIGMDAEQEVLARMGLALEPVIRFVAERDLKTTIAPGFFVQHPEHAFLGVSPDGQDEKTGWLVEFKSHGYSTQDEWGEEMTDELPAAFHVQTTWQLGMTGAEKCIVVAFHRDTGHARYYVVESNPEYFESLVKITIRFYHEHILAKVEPKATSAIDLPIVREIYAKPSGDVLLATDEHDEIAGQYLELSKLNSAAKKQLDELKAQLIQGIGYAMGIKTIHGTFTYKPRKDGVRVLRAPTD